MRRGAPVSIIAILVALLLGSYVVYTQAVVADLRREALRSSTAYAHLYRALSDTTEGASTQALLDLARSIREHGVPLIVTDAGGRPAAHANLPGIADDVPADDDRVRAFVRRLDAENAPVSVSGVGHVHYGNTPLVKALRIIPVLQAVTAAILLLAAVFIVRTRGRAARERIWAGMARESAHQLGTPLSSLAGWIELLGERAVGGDTLRHATEQMRADLERLERVAHRFERIGHEPRRQPVDVRALVDRVGSYFRARVPTRSHAIAITVRHEAPELTVLGDPVLLEWALEALTKNAVDALAGRGGAIHLSTARVGDAVRIRVADDGPGIPREHRARVFEPGFSTKPSGWGVGLALARRIVEEGHSGRLALAAADRGATFDVILR
ncbi:MAG: HAMP domain-containing histidine kinase [Gemmatimonadota bacterium]|nr:HAMP domain-containing histidine kinase [Gemmatimonadota bacterium]